MSIPALNRVSLAVRCYAEPRRVTPSDRGECCGITPDGTQSSLSGTVMNISKQAYRKEEGTIVKTTIRDYIVRCPLCGQRFKHRTWHAGRMIRCRRCNGRIGAITQSPSGDQRSRPAREKGVSRSACRPSAVASEPAEVHPPTVLLLECRDDVFRSVARELTAAGIVVLRAVTANGALDACSKQRFDMVIANADPPVRGGWRVAECLWERKAESCVWLYQATSAAIDFSHAKAYGVAELISYGRDLAHLADRILDCLAGRPPRPGRDESIRDADRSLTSAA